MTNILALDTATNACSAAVLVDGKIIASRYEEMVRGHAERLVPMVAEITEESEIPIKSINLVAVTVGPGAFTGIRVGLAAARGFALSAGEPCLGLTTLEVMAADICSRPFYTLIALDSRREDVYFQIFDSRGAALTEASVALPEQVSVIASQHITNVTRIVLAGDGVLVVSEYLKKLGIQSEISPVRYPQASVLAKLAASRLSLGNIVTNAAPIYLRPPDAVLPPFGGRLRF